MAASHIADDTMVVVSMTASNPHGVPIRYRDRFVCGAFVRLHAEATRSVVAWDQRDWLNSRPGGCKGISKERVMGPGDSVVYAAAASVREILGDSLSGGTYWVSGVLLLGAPDLSSTEVPAGSVVLSPDP